MHKVIKEITVTSTRKGVSSNTITFGAPSVTHTIQDILSTEIDVQERTMIMVNDNVIMVIYIDKDITVYYTVH